MIISLILNDSKLSINGVINRNVNQLMPQQVSKICISCRIQEQMQKSSRTQTMGRSFTFNNNSMTYTHLKLKL